MQPIIIIIPVIDRSLIPAPEKDRGPLINWTQKRDSLIYQAEQKKIRPLGEEDKHRVLQLEAYITLLRSLTWDGEGIAPELPPIPSYTPPPTEAAVSIPDPRDEALASARARIAELEAAAEEPSLLPEKGSEDEAAGPDEPDDVVIEPQDASVIVDGFVSEFREGREVAEETMRSMDPPDRKRLFSILNRELGRLKNEEALLGKSIPRRADVESLLGILARVGEA